jgi:hypothetical protein
VRFEHSMGRTLVTIQRPESESPTHYTWVFPGSPIQVRLALDIVERLQKHLNRSDKSSAEHGLLLGQVVGQITIIDDFRAISSPNPPSINEVAALHPSGASGVVGYYRVQRETALRLNDGDVALARVVFPAPHQVFLLIQPSDSGPATATFFFWDEGRMCGDFPFLEFPFDSSILAIAERQRLQATQKKSLAKPHPVHPRLPEDRPAPRGRTAKALKIAGLFAALLITGTLVAMATRLFPGKFWPPTWAKLLSTPVASFRQIPLGLQVQRQNGDLKLTWNRESPAILHATSWVLSIEEEGGGKREIALDRAQVRNGSILYAPTTDEIQMQLTVFDSGASNSESVIVILPKASAPRVQPLGVQASEHRDVPAAPIADANPASSIVLQRPTKPFTPPESSHAGTQAPALPVNEPPAVSSRTDPAALILLELMQSVAPPHQLATARPAPTRPIDSMARQEPTPAATVYYPPVIISSVTPLYPPELKGLFLKSKIIEVKVSIDEAGRVVMAEALPPKVWAPKLMINKAVEAARLFKFKPARRNSQPVSGEMVVQFNFKPPQ